MFIQGLNPQSALLMPLYILSVLSSLSSGQLFLCGIKVTCWLRNHHLLSSYTDIKIFFQVLPSPDLVTSLRSLSFSDITIVFTEHFAIIGSIFRHHHHLMTSFHFTLTLTSLSLDLTMTLECTKDHFWITLCTHKQGSISFSKIPGRLYIPLLKSCT